MTSRIAAFFDLDNTIVPGPAIEHPYFRLLWRQGLVGPKDLLRSVGVLLRDIPPFSFDPLRRYKAYLAGKPIESIEAPAQHFFWEHILPRISDQQRPALAHRRASSTRVAAGPGPRRGAAGPPCIGADPTPRRTTEIFSSIEGESAYAGRPCVFVRLTGCPLRCTWCDTAYAFHGGTERSLESILAEVARHECRLVEITGGEPLAQSEVHGLITALADRGYTVLIETSGGLDITPVDPRAVLIMGLKCPARGMEERKLWGNLPQLQPTDEGKFVIKDRGDYEWAVAKIREHALTDKHTLLLSPVFGELDPRTLAEWVLAYRLPVRLQLQLKADGQPVGQHPLGERPRVQFTEDGTEQERVLVRQRVLADLCDGPLVVPAVLDHEFDLVRRLELREVGPEVPVFHAAAGALKIHDESGPRVHRRNVERAARLDQHRVPAIGQCGDEPMDLALRERLASGDLHQPALVALRFGADAPKDAFRASLEGGGRVRPRPPQRAAR